jgi:flagella basal body P-ring formation protein FlgA
MDAALYIGARIRIDGSYVVSNRAIPSGQKISADDLRMVEGELTAQAPDILTSLQQAIGRSARSFIAAERPLRLALLRSEVAIQSGQDVKVLAAGQGFEVENRGRALESAGIGDSIRIRMENGQIVNGVVRAKDVVEARF